MIVLAAISTQRGIAEYQLSSSRMCRAHQVAAKLKGLLQNVR